MVQMVKEEREKPVSYNQTTDRTQKQRVQGNKKPKRSDTPKSRQQTVRKERDSNKFTKNCFRCEKRNTDHFTRECENAPYCRVCRANHVRGKEKKCAGTRWDPNVSSSSKPSQGASNSQSKRVPKPQKKTSRRVGTLQDDRSHSEGEEVRSSHSSSEAGDSDGSGQRHAINTIFTTQHTVGHVQKGSTVKGRDRPKDSHRSYAQAVSQAPRRQVQNEGQRSYHSANSSSGRSSSYRTRVFHSRSHRNEYSDVSFTSSESSEDEYAVTRKSQDHHRRRFSDDCKARTTQKYGYYSF